MNLSAPTMVVFIIAVVLALLAILIFVNVIPFAAVPSFWIMTLAFVVLAAGCMFKGA